MSYYWPKDVIYEILQWSLNDPDILKYRLVSKVWKQYIDDNLEFCQFNNVTYAAKLFPKIKRIIMNNKLQNVTNSLIH